MDTTKAITHISLCAGYGGIDLGLKRVVPSMRTIAFSEIEAFACANLVAKMEAGLLDAAPVWTDVKTFPWSEFRGKVDLLSGGYPCQPFSSAGRRRGKEDPRHLWPWIADGISAMRPRRVFFENVEGHISLGLREVIESLEGIGYQATWGIFSAVEVGASHRRKRVFIMADSCVEGLQGHWRSIKVGYEKRWETEEGHTSEGDQPIDAWPARPGEDQFYWEPRRVVGNTASLFGNGSKNRSKRCESGWQISKSGNTNRSHGTHGLYESTLGGVSDGPSGGLGYAELCEAKESFRDELRLLGNGVVPAVAAKAFVTLHNRLTS